jgi:lysophospholipase L1-like esterase
MYKGGLYLAIGDSVTWAPPHVAKGDDLYAHRIWRTLCSQYGPIRFINKGIGGATSNDLVTNLAWSTAMAPDLVTIGIGLNDSANQQVSTTIYKDNLRKIIDALRLRNPKVHIILCTPSTTTDATRTNNVQAYRTAMSEVSTEKQVGICNFHTAWTTSAGDMSANVNADLLHPNSTGHQKLYNLLYPIVQTGSWLTEVGQ